MTWTRRVRRIAGDSDLHVSCVVSYKMLSSTSRLSSASVSYKILSRVSVKKSFVTQLAGRLLVGKIPQEWDLDSLPSMEHRRTASAVNEFRSSKSRSTLHGAEWVRRRRVMGRPSGLSNPAIAIPERNLLLEYGVYYTSICTTP